MAGVPNFRFIRIRVRVRVRVRVKVRRRHYKFKSTLALKALGELGLGELGLGEMGQNRIPVQSDHKHYCITTSTKTESPSV